MENTVNLELTEEQLQKSVEAAYNSVALINELNQLETRDEEQEATLQRNVEHIRIMMGREWFVAALTDSQIVELQAI